MDLSDRIQLRTATANDLELLLYWDRQEHVKDSDPDSDWQWQKELLREPDWREQLMAELDGRPIGFVQIIDPVKEDHHYWGDYLKDTNNFTGSQNNANHLRAIDIWLGEADNLGRGYGTEVMQQAIACCFSSPDVSAILIDPLKSNGRAQHIELIDFRKNDVLQQKGKIAQWMYTVISGVIREHVVRVDGDDISIMFHEAPVGTGSLHSYHAGEGSLYSLSAVTDGSAYRISCQDFAELLETNTELSMWYAEQLRVNCVKMQKHIIDMTCRTSEERLCYLMSKHPTLVDIVPSYQLASYLNMTPVSFCRSKKKILNNERDIKTLVNG